MAKVGGAAGVLSRDYVITDSGHYVVEHYTANYFKNVSNIKYTHVYVCMVLALGSFCRSLLQ